MGCKISEDLLDSWAERLVFPREPIFLKDDMAKCLLPGTVVLSADEFGANQVAGPLDLRDSYRTYGLKARGLSLALLSPGEFTALPRQTQLDILSFQAEMERGQIYDLHFVASVLDNDDQLLAVFEPTRFETAQGPKVALRHDLWQSLPKTVQHKWLTRYVSEDEPSCLSSSFSEDRWSDLTQLLGPQVRTLAGTFAARSGPNCFATALAAITPIPDISESIADSWLHQQPFLRGLQQRGLAPAPFVDAPPAGSVLVWFDKSDTAQHACVSLGNGFVLNKSAQRWSAPRQILRQETVLADWSGGDLTLRLYVR